LYNHFEWLIQKGDSKTSRNGEKGGPARKLILYKNKNYYTNFPYKK